MGRSAKLSTADKANIALINERIQWEFPPMSFGYEKTLENCEMIVNSPLLDGNTFMMLTKDRKIQIDRVNQDNYDDIEASVIVGGWLKENKIEHSIVKANIYDVHDHVFIRIPGYGNLGATPVDQNIRKMIIKDKISLNCDLRFDDFKAFKNAIPFNGLRPMCWDILNEGAGDMFVQAGIIGQGASMTAMFKISYLYYNRLKATYFYSLQMDKKRVFINKGLAKHQGPHYLFEMFKEIESPNVIEDGQMSSPVIKDAKDHYQHIFYDLLTKLDTKSFEDSPKVKGR